MSSIFIYSLWYRPFIAVQLYMIHSYNITTSCDLHLQNLNVHYLTFPVEAGLEAGLVTVDLTDRSALHLTASIQSKVVNLMSSPLCEPRPADGNANPHFASCEADRVKSGKN